jgi:hypothetical protein
MCRTRILLGAFAFVAFSLALAASAQAQAVRTYVASYGDDVNPCSRNAPCRTFAGAINKTFINGEIDCLDQYGYGAVSIFKSITIDCRSTHGGILASGVTGVTITLNDNSGNDPLHIVRLRGLVINGAGGSGTVGTRTGINGIRVNTATGTAPTVIVEDVVVDGFTQNGINWVATGGNLIVKDSTFTNNAQRGIFVDSAGTVRVEIDNTTTDFNQEGVRFDDNVVGTISRSRAANNSLNGYTCFPGGTGSSEMTIHGSTSANNLQWGVVAAGTGVASCTVRVGDSTVTNNSVSGFQINAGGSLLSSGRNRVTAPTMAPTGPFTEQ